MIKPGAQAAKRNDEWGLDPDFLTVNHGSFGATPRSVLAAQRAWQDRLERQPSRFMSTLYPAAIRNAAADLGRFLNADPDNLVFVDNATTGCNAVLRSLSLKADDEVIILSHAYGAVRNAVRHVADQAGARITVAEVPFPDPDEESVAAAVANAITQRTRLAVIDHITSGSALVLPVARLVAICHAAGVRGPDRRRPCTRPNRPRPEHAWRRLVCWQLPQMALRAERMRVSARPRSA